MIARRVVGALAEGVLGVVELGAREPRRTGHLARGEDFGAALADAEAIPDRAPEALEVLDRPALQVAVGLEAALAHVRAHGRALQQVVGRGPEDRRRHRSAIMPRSAAHGDRHALRHPAARGRLAAGHRRGRRRRPVRAQVPRRGAGAEGARGRDRRRRAGPRARPAGARAGADRARPGAGQRRARPRDPGPDRGQRGHQPRPGLPARLAALRPEPRRRTRRSPPTSSGSTR